MNAVFTFAGMRVIVKDDLPLRHFANAITIIVWPSAKPLRFVRPGDKLYSDDILQFGDTLIMSPANLARLNDRLLDGRERNLMPEARHG
jgi:hypothetical protein